MRAPLAVDESGTLRLTQAFGGNKYAEAYATTYAGKPVKVIGHTGIDINAVIGTPVYAVWPGAVYHGWDAAGFGNYLVLHVADGREALYGHLNAFAVQNGQRVGAGQLIGWSGNTGRSTGGHLHFQVRDALPDYFNGFYGCHDPISGFDHDVIPLLNTDLIG